MYLEALKPGLHIFICEYVFQLCEKITGGNPILTDICEGLVEDKLPDIIDYLVNGLPPYEICQKITGNCPEMTSTTSTPKPPGKLNFIIIKSGLLVTELNLGLM